MEPILSVNNLEKFYKTKRSLTKAVDHISFDVQAGEYVGIMGASGSGKTTLLNCISTIDHATAGQIYVNGRDITKLDKEGLAAFRRQELGFIFQDFNLLDTLTARDNIALALAIKGEKASDVDRMVEDAARDLGILDMLDRYPCEMSGGQQQRTACARAMVTKPTLILADEPTGSLDSKWAGILLECFQIMNEKQNATILMVTHDAFTASHCRRILFIRDGRLFNELARGRKERKEFFEEIIEVVSLLGGGQSHVD